MIIKGLTQPKDRVEEEETEEIDVSELPSPEEFIAESKDTEKPRVFSVIV